MKRLTLLLLCALTAACSATTKTWRPNGFSRPPGVPQDVFDHCANRMLGDTGRITSGAAEEGRFPSFDTSEQDCARAEYLRACFRAAHQAERSAGLRLRPNASGWGPDREDFLDEAVDRLCDDEGGGTPRVRGLVRVLNEHAEDAGQRCIPCSTH
ncbi:hypothetical protein [Myxococcus virescens]|uniref:Lipoprotein n=1 Tax=Myxococcus virescens TaxID=83456 RepID=A0A511HP75_9BACT|nr:hypothetical protein [Myxococcus virescens]GEL75393.1 hypothetical protein MVI01_71770 [Myxococcus virescens]SDE65841.1 hypothetical protein SAMN04488504_109307 [Myxococcus virescens]